MTAQTNLFIDTLEGCEAGGRHTPDRNETDDAWCSKCGERLLLPGAAGGPGLTQMPVAGLDDLTPERAAQEIRGAVYQARRLLARAEEGGNPTAIREARRTLATRLCIARSERIVPFFRRPGR